jgi:hypothetical protein
MVATEFISLMENARLINPQQLVALKLITEKYPYFQSARALYLKGLKNSENFKYNNELKVTAAYTTDRTVLFNFISSKDFNPLNGNIYQQPIEKPSKEINTPIPTPEKTEEFSSEKPLSFSPIERYSFGEWLNLTSKKPIQRPLEKSKEEESLINQFIKNNPKINPLEKGKEITISIPENKQESSLMTETLAKVYFAQNKYKNAIQAYKVLSLKYPEKSGFFADQIKRIQILQKNKS